MLPRFARGDGRAAQSSSALCRGPRLVYLPPGIVQRLDAVETTGHRHLRRSCVDRPDARCYICQLERTFHSAEVASDENQTTLTEAAKHPHIHARLRRRELV